MTDLLHTFLGELVESNVVLISNVSGIILQILTVSIANDEVAANTHGMQWDASEDHQFDF